jgi:hypothetical protein
MGSFLSAIAGPWEPRSPRALASGRLGEGSIGNSPPERNRTNHLVRKLIANPINIVKYHDIVGDHIERIEEAREILEKLLTLL